MSLSNSWALWRGYIDCEINFYMKAIDPRIQFFKFAEFLRNRSFVAGFKFGGIN